MSATLRRAIGIVLAAAWLGGAAWFVTSFRENLHCTQWTSFRIAAFDMVPHEEEEFETGVPYVYRPGFAIPLRVYFSLSLLAFLLVAPIGALAVALGRLRYRGWLASSSATTCLVVLNSFLPEVVVGERFKFLGIAALIFAVIPLAFLALVLRRSLGRSVNQVAT